MAVRLFCFVLDSLVFQDDVRQPHGVTGDTDYTDAVVVRGVPDQSVVGPLLLATVKKREFIVT